MVLLSKLFEIQMLYLWFLFFFNRIDTLTMIRLKQDELAKINALGIYSSSQLDYFGIG